VPTAVRLGFQVPAASSDTRWVVQVQLNGRLVASTQLAGSGTQQVNVALPAGQEKLRNVLTVTLLRDRDVGGCNVRQTTYAVQLLPESALVLGGRGAGFTGVPATFATGFEVVLPASSADAPAETLTSLVPTLAEFSGWQQVADVSWDGSPGARPFLSFGPVPDGVKAPVSLADGRLSGSGFDLQSFADGLVVETATATAGGSGLVVTATGDTADAVVPAYGREVARVIATRGGGFVVSGSGRVVTVPPTRAETSP
jgi:cellulose synthase operon protein B